MRIGFDFDNTIVSYDALFYRVAVDQSLVPTGLPPTKLAVRDYLRKAGHEDAWTELQGYVYGARMDDAEAYPDVIAFMRLARAHGIAMSIVSHKTRYPFMGPKYDLHAAARGWVEGFLVDGNGALIEPDQVFFELTKEDKVARVAHVGCDYFIDDLPEILQMPGFPPGVGRILFDPDHHHADDGAGERLGSWQEIARYFEERWKPPA